ncbi:Leucine--tRNA ligase, partial [Mycoplasma putrefaciens]
MIKTKDQSKAFVGEDIHINSDILDGLDRVQALEVIYKYLEDNHLGIRKINYKLRDW